MRIILLCLIALTTTAQINPIDFCVGFDYNNTSTGVWNQSQLRRVAMLGEKSLNQMFSVEAYYSFEGNGYAPFSYSLGQSYYNTWGGYKFNRTYNDIYVGVRMYPIDQYHSTAIQLRNKKNYGWYVSYGYDYSQYHRREFLLTTRTENVTDQDGNLIFNQDGSVLQTTVTDKFDTWDFTLSQWGVNFGVGWKMYHSRWLYTDFGVYTNAYRPKNRSVTGNYVQHMDERIVPNNTWEAYLDAVREHSDNGRGMLVRMMIGINLDYRK